MVFVFRYFVFLMGVVLVIFSGVFCKFIWFGWMRRGVVVFRSVIDVFFVFE